MTYSSLWNWYGPTILGLQRLSLELAKVGYRNGQPIPDRPATISFPAGTHHLTSPLMLHTGDVVKGAGIGKTILQCPSLQSVLGQGTYGAGPGWEWGGGFLWATNVSEVGIEDLTIQFPGEKWAGHHLDVGNNGVFFENSQDCWIKNVQVLDADNAFLLDGTRYTARHLDIGCPKRGAVKYAGHYGVSTQGGSYILLDDVAIRAFLQHDTSVGHKTDTVVFRGRGWDVNFDHHKDNFPALRVLYDGFDTGKKTRLYANGGADKPGYVWYGTGDILWGCYGRNADGTKSPIGYIPPEWTGLTIVGNKPLSSPPTASQYQEVLDLNALEPFSLYDALVAYAATPAPVPTPTIEEVIRAKFVALGFTDVQADRIMAGL